MALVVVWEVFVQEVRGDQLQDSVPEELHPLVAAQGQVVKPDRPVRERS